MAPSRGRHDLQRLIDSGRRHQTLLAVAGYVLLILALLGPSLVGGKVLSSGDVAYFQEPFYTERPATLLQSSNPYLTDPVWQFVPDQWRTRQALEQGALPLWNANVGAGRPLLASQQHAPLFPPNWLAFVLPFWSSLAYVVALKLLAAALGTYLLARALGLGWAPGFLAGTAFAFCTYLISWMFWPLTNAWIMLPWLFLATRGVCRRGRPPDVLALTALIGILFFAGHPESELLVLVALAAWVIFQLYDLHREQPFSRRTYARRGGLVAVSLFGGLALSAVATIPFLEFLSHSYPSPRGGPPAPASILYSWIFPELWGRPDNMFQGNGPLNYLERTAYIGVLPLLLALAGLAFRPRRAQLFFAGVAVVAVAVVLPTPVNALVRALPNANYIALTRLLSILCFAAALLAGFGAQRLLEATAHERARMLRLMAVLAALPLAWPLWRFIDHRSFSHWLAALGQLPAVQHNEGSEQAVQLGAVWRWVVIALIAVGGLAAFTRLGATRKTAMASFAVIVVALDLITINQGFLPQVSEAQANPPTPPVLHYIRAQAGDGRVMGIGLALYPNLADRYGTLDPRAYDFPLPDRYERLFLALGGGASDLPIVALNNPRLVQIADLFAVRYVIFPAPLFVRSAGRTQLFERNPGGLPRSWVAYSWRPAKTSGAALFVTVGSTARQSEASPAIEGAAPPPAPPLAPTPARVTVDHAQEVEVQAIARRAGYLILDDSYYPGWQASVDGHPTRILPANENFRAVAIPAGRHVITFRYRPASFIAGAAISLATALLMVAYGVFWWARGRQRRQGGRASAPAETEAPVSLEPSSDA